MIVPQARMCLASLALTAVLAGSLPARAGDSEADDGPDAAAAALFRQGRDLVKQGQWQQGCSQLAASMKRYPAPSTLLNLALCREHDGQVASAWAMAQRARILNRETAGAGRRARLDAAGDKLIERLLPRIPHLRVIVTPAVAGAQLQDNGHELPINTPLPLDPGPHELRIVAPGYDPVTRTVVLREGEKLAVDITLTPTLQAAPTVTTTPAETAPSNPVATASEPAAVGRPQPAIPRTVDDDDQAVPVWAWAVGAGGIVLSGLAIGFTVDAVSASNALKDRCGDDLICNEDLSFDPDPLNRRKNRSTALAIGFGAGGAAAIVAAIVGAATAAGSGDGATAGSIAGLSFGGYGSPGGAGLYVYGWF